MPLPGTANASRHAVTDETWTSEVLLSDLPVLVDFTADWCAPCRKLTPILAELAEQFAGRLRIAEIDADTNPGACRDYGVLSMPTLIMFKDGEPVRSMTGLRPRPVIAEWLEAAL
jgi:thioredoxin 1